MDSSSAGNATASLADSLMNRRSWEGGDVNGGALQVRLPNPARRGTRLSRGLRIHQPLEKHLRELGRAECQPLGIPPTACSAGKATGRSRRCPDKQSY